MSEEFSEIVLWIIRDMAWTQYVFIFCAKKFQHRTSCSKVSRVHVDNKSIYVELKKAAEDYEFYHEEWRNYKTKSRWIGLYIDMYTTALSTSMQNISRISHIAMDSSQHVQRIDQTEEKYHDQQTIQCCTYQSFLYQQNERDQLDSSTVYRGPYVE